MSSVMIVSTDSKHDRAGVRVLKVHISEVFGLIGKTLELIVCKTCGHVHLENDMELISMGRWDPRSAFMTKLIPKLGIDQWGHGSRDIGARKILGAIYFATIATYSELGLTCPKCGLILPELGLPRIGN